MNSIYKYSLKRSARFEREVRKAEKRGLRAEELDAVVEKLRKDEQLERKHHDHPLHGEYEGYRECHINPDWLLIYRKYKDKLVLLLSRTGTHSDLFT